MSADSAIAAPDVRSLLYERLGIEGDTSYEDALRRAAGDDPLLQALLQSFQRSSAGVDIEDDDVATEDDATLGLSAGFLAELQAGYEQAAEDIATLERRLARLAHEVSTLREVSDTLAAALGACASCWGDDPACLACRGRGGPGAISPEPRLFRELVMPAVRRVQRDHAAGRPRQAATVQSTHRE